MANIKRFSSSRKDKKGDIMSDVKSLYENSEFGRVIHDYLNATDVEARKYVALACLKLGCNSAAMEKFTVLLKEGVEVQFALFNLGLCNYALYEYEKAHSYFVRAAGKKSNSGLDEQVDEWLNKTLDKFER
jgi:tetratricopeptide (TPR) repeat protein